MNGDGSNPHRLTNTSSYKFSLAWSPDGKLLAFDQFLGNGIELIDLDSRALERLPQKLLLEYSP